MALLRWWLVAYAVAVVAGTAWSTWAQPPGARLFAPGVALLYALQAPPLVLVAGAAALALEWGLAWVLAPLGATQRAVLAAGAGAGAGALAVIWAAPQPGLVAVGTLAGAAAGLAARRRPGPGRP